MIKRIYDLLLEEHFRQNQQMAFLSGPRQVGKTTTSQTTQNSHIYISWDNQTDRIDIIKGPNQIAEKNNLYDIGNFRKRIIFDEIHKYSKWKNFIKGFYDKFGKNFNTVVTGSARLNIYKKGGDSLMGRYFLYRMHPLSVAELVSPLQIEPEIKNPKKIDNATFEQLINFGGFPEPFLKCNTRFYNRWKKLRMEQLFKEDLRDLTKIQEIAQIEILAEILQHQAGQLINYSSLANQINVSVDTIRRWIITLEFMNYSFLIRPWFKNVPKSLRKQPKIYLWDWSTIANKSFRFENFIASHLKKAVDFWTDAGFADYKLYFIRDKNQKEVDFLIVRDEKPWILVEVKSSEKQSLSASLKHFHNLLKTEYAFQISADAPYIEYDCFSINTPVKVPAITFLSQLV